MIVDIVNYIQYNLLINKLNISIYVPNSDELNYLYFEYFNHKIKFIS